MRTNIERAKRVLNAPPKSAAPRQPAPHRVGIWEATYLITEKIFARLDLIEADIAAIRGDAPAATTTLKGEGQRVELELRGEVNQLAVDRLIQSIKGASTRAEIVLRVTTGGGDHAASLDLAECLLAHKGPVRTIAEGQCASAGVSIFMAGDKDARLASRDAMFTIHKGSFDHMPAGWTASFAEGVESGQSDHLARMFSARTGTPWHRFRQMMRSEKGVTLDAVRARELAIVSDILPAPAKSRRATKPLKAPKRRKA